MQINERVKALAKQCLEHGYKIVAAESCTGGWLAHAIISEPGCSAWFEGSIVSYSNHAKMQWLHVSPSLIATHGAVSEAVARAMVQGVLSSSDATHAVSITGFAGPDGEQVGLIWFAWASQTGAVRAEAHQLTGDRTQIRSQAVLIAIDGLFR